MGADAWRACQLGIRLLKNLGNTDFLQIGDRLVFSCLRIILWWRDVMRRWISDLVSAGFYSCPPCPWTSWPCPKLSPQQLSFIFPRPLALMWRCLCFTRQTLATLATQHFSPSMCLKSEITKRMYDRPARCDHANSHAYSPSSRLWGWALW